MDTPLQRIESDIAWQLPNAPTFEHDFTRQLPTRILEKARSHSLHRPLTLLASVVVLLPFLAMNIFVAFLLSGRNVGMSPSLFGMVLLVLVSCAIPLLIMMKDLRPVSKP